MSDLEMLMEVYDHLEAEIIREALGAKGISATLFQESVAALYPAGFGPLNKVEICVPVEQFERAKAWLAEYEAGTMRAEVLMDDESATSADEAVEDAEDPEQE